MLQPARRILLPLIVIIAFAAVFSCSERACTVRANHAKWKHYNGLQYGGNKAVKKR
jgi:hypothetical protein